jgi:L-ascorbate metabolism protein UlaG (beta-lactamase superfamily)
VSVVGTESTANIARGAGVLEDQIILATNGDTFEFGQFTVTLITSRHVPNGFGDSHLVAGFMAEPIRQPAVFTQWREGGSWSVLISHLKGTTLVQGSAGYIEDALTDVQADVVMLSVAGLKRQGPVYAGEYWRQVVEATGAKRVYLIHHDDFTQRFGDVKLFPKVLDNVVTSVQWLSEFAASGEQRVELLLPPFGEPISLY